MGSGDEKAKDKTKEVELKDLSNERDVLEKKISDLKTELELSRAEKLVDENGYPRADLDVYRIRHSRHDLAVLETDYRLLMDKIEQIVLEIFSEKQQNTTTNTNLASTRFDSNLRYSSEATTSTLQQSVDNFEHLQPFAVIQSVQSNSPAAEAGLIAGDEVIVFGNANIHNNRELQAVKEIVHSNINNRIFVLVSRQIPGRATFERMKIDLVPHLWTGNGVLGCHFIPKS